MSQNHRKSSKCVNHPGWGPSSLAKLVNIIIITRWCMILKELSLDGGFKPTNITGGPILSPIEVYEVYLMKRYAQLTGYKRIVP